MKERGGATKRGKRRFAFIGETIAELKKVVWLSRREIAYLTVMVLIISILAGAFLGVFDYGFTALVDHVFIGG